MSQQWCQCCNGCERVVDVDFDKVFVCYALDSYMSAVVPSEGLYRLKVPSVVGEVL